MWDINTIRNKITEILNTLTWTNQPFDYIYDYHTLESEWYPYVSFEPTQLLQSIEDTASNKRTFVFDLYIYQEINKKTREEGLQILLDAFDKVIDKFDTNYTLDWTAIQVTPLEGSFDQIVLEKGKVLFVNLQLQVEVFKNIT